MRRLRSSALLLVLALCSIGWAQTQQQQPSTQQALAVQSQQKSQHPSTDFDRGIRLTPAAGEAMCGSIVSYNFSQGEAPKLESVTTCTPSTTVVTRRARGVEKKPQGPQLQKTAFSPHRK